MRFAPTLDDLAAMQPLAQASDARRALMPRRVVAQPAIDENCHALCGVCRLHHHIDDDCPVLPRHYYDDQP